MSNRPSPCSGEIQGQAREFAYRFGTRTLNVHFFRPGELYENPKVPGRMNVLRNRHAEHGGYIEIQEHGEDREGWNLVLLRQLETGVGEWLRRRGAPGLTVWGRRRAGSACACCAR